MSTRLTEEEEARLRARKHEALSAADERRVWATLDAERAERRALEAAAGIPEAAEQLSESLKALRERAEQAERERDEAARTVHDLNASFDAAAVDARVTALTAHAHQLEAALRAVANALRIVSRVADNSDNDEHEAWCPWCNSEAPAEHADTCERKVALALADKALAASPGEALAAARCATCLGLGWTDYENDTNTYKKCPDCEGSGRALLAKEASGESGPGPQPLKPRENRPAAEGLLSSGAQPQSSRGGPDSSSPDLPSTLADAFDWIEPMAAGYVRANLVGRNAEILEHARAIRSGDGSGKP